MDSLVPNPHQQTRRVALLVIGRRAMPLLCPFFGKCDGFLLLDPSGRPAEYYPNEQRTADALCDLIVKSGANALICGFVGAPERRKLLTCGVDVRLGSCARPIDELAASFYDLPPA